MRTCKSATLLLTILFSLLGLAFAQPARGQFIGFTSPQTIATTFTVTDCTSQQLLSIPNSGQSNHYLIYSFTGLTPVTVKLFFEGTNDGTTFTQISDTSTGSSNGSLIGVGYFNIVRVNLLCTGTGAVPVKLNYSGTSVGNQLPVTGGADFSGYYKQLAVNASQGSNLSRAFLGPYANTSGTL